MNVCFLLLFFLHEKARVSLFLVSVQDLHFRDPEFYNICILKNYLQQYLSQCLLCHFFFFSPLQVRDIVLHPEMFSVQNGLLTPTLKAKRTELRSHFREQIDELYAKIKM